MHSEFIQGPVEEKTTGSLSPILAGNWQAVIMHLEAYCALAKQYRSACLANDNQEPADLEPEDQVLLDLARAHVQ